MSKEPRLPESASSAFTRTERDQRRAADPVVSAWVSANAGAGKTHVLVTRLLRILLSGTPPERILCLTFTKAAAAEMAGRVFKRLAAWVTMADDALREDLAKLDGADPSLLRMEAARDLFARAMETPGGLKVQTIHAFCERLLQRFPLEAAVPPRFAILEDERRKELLREATDHVLMQAVRDPAGDLGRAHAVAVRYAAEDRFDEVLRAALGLRDVLADAERDLGQFTDVLRRHCGVAKNAEIGALEDALANVLADTTIVRARDALAAGSTNDQKCAALLERALGAHSREARIEELADFFLTDKGQPRKSLVTKKTAADNTWLEPALSAAQSEFHSLHVAHRSLVVVEATLALVRLAAAVLQRYTQLKHARAALDFDDLIELSASLLKQPGHADWVLFKLDGGLDHILVDEAQDTSPQQWDVVTALANEFFSGAGAREDARPRTVFAVGDEKQSIYGFQGADPKLFEEHGAHFQRLVREAGQTWCPVPLQLSFRTVVPVLDAVDRVFADASRTPGVTSPDKTIRHISNRIGCAGLVELWEPEKHEEADAAEVWSPGSDSAPRGTVTRLAERIAKTIRHWIDTQEMLTSEGRPIRPGDILILVRKRQPFADAMVAALEAQKVPVAGADRIRLTRQIAVRDLIVLGQFLLLPEDDLALATVLKSPLFDLDDADLIAIAPERKGTLWSALLRAADDAPRFRPAAETLKRWRSRSDLMPPFEFFSEVLDRDGMRSRLLTRLGPESSDAIDELLTLAISYDDGAPPSLQGFVHWLQESEHDIKRDLEHGRDEVRVMTVHGAKGLEAPIVFLPDTCSAAAAGRGAGLLVCESARRPGKMAAPFIWPVRGATGLGFVDTARGDGRARDTEEHHRLLYVALTRARDRLYVAGFEGKRPRSQDCWYDLVSTALDGHLVPVTDTAGREVRRLECAQEAAPMTRDEAHSSGRVQVALPDWAMRSPPAEPTRLVPLVPSRLAPLDSDAEGEPVEPVRMGGPYEAAAPSPSAGPDALRFVRGTLTHALLQHLPGLDPSKWRQAADRLVEARGAALAERVRSGIVAETLAVLTDPAFADLFGPSSRAEVPIVAELSPPKGGAGPMVRVTGQIDRLVQLQDRVLIVDYKTNRPPPTDTANVPETYLLQLAAYRLAVGQIFAPLPVHAALLWTYGPRIMEIPPAMLDAAELRLFAAEAAR